MYRYQGLHSIQGDTYTLIFLRVWVQVSAAGGSGHSATLFQAVLSLSYHQYNYESDSLLKTHSTVEDSETTEKNEVERAGPGRQRLGKYRSPVSRHSIRSCALIYCWLGKWEFLIALGSNQGR